MPLNGAHFSPREHSTANQIDCYRPYILVIMSHPMIAKRDTIIVYPQLGRCLGLPVICCVDQLIGCNDCHWRIWP